MSDGRDGRVVLIVQEELVIRMDVVEAFETGGFKIFQADTAEKAIDVLQSEPTSAKIEAAQLRSMPSRLPL